MTNEKFKNTIKMLDSIKNGTLESKSIKDLKPQEGTKTNKLTKEHLDIINELGD